MDKFNVEQFVVKIKAPVIVRIGDVEMSFDDGKTLAEYKFDKRYLVDQITIEDGKAVITLLEQEMPNVNWMGSEEVSFF